MIGVCLSDILGKTRLHLGVFGGILRIDCTVQVQIMVTTVRARHIGDVPDSVGSRRIHDRTTSQSVRKTLRTPLRVVLVVTRLLESTVEECRIKSVLQLAVSSFLLVLCNNIRVSDGIQKACAIHADRVLQQHLITLRFQQSIRVAVALVIHIYRRVWHSNLRINQLIRLAVGELVSMLVHSRKPFHSNLTRVQRSLKRRYAKQLRHTRQPGHISVRGRIEHH